MQEAGLERAAVGMLRTLGAGRVALLISNPMSGSGQSGLGIETAMISEVEVEPVLLQTEVNGTTLVAIVTGKTLQRMLANTELCGIDDLSLRRALESSMLRANGIQYRIAAVDIKRICGAALIYELQIEE